MKKTWPEEFEWKRVSTAGALAVLVMGVGAAGACSAGGDPNQPIGAGATSGSGATGGRTVATGGGTVILDAGPDPDDPDAALRCDDMRIASIGRVARYGDNQNDSTDAFVSWLNEKSSAQVDIFTTQQPLTPEFLSSYNVIILQDLAGWAFSPDEIQAFSSWVHDLGGGVITMTGYDAASTEVIPTNTLLQFAGVQYNQDDTLGSCPDNCCYCTGSSVPTRGWNESHPITEYVQAVGSFHGRSITSTNPDAVVISEMDGATLGAAVQTGVGRMFVWHDEWVTYTSQWQDTGSHPECRDPNNPCYGHAVELLFQTSQFWFNVIRWVSQCDDFEIREPEIIY